MDKLGLGCPFSFLGGKEGRTQGIRAKPDILQLNYDCYLEILSYLTALEDQLNLGRAHILFHQMLANILPTRYGKINVKMLKSIQDWEYMLQLCGSSVVRCEVPHGRWDESFTHPFLDLLNQNCSNLQQLVLIFMHSDTDTPPASRDSRNGHANIMQLLMELPGLRNLTLIDARAPQLQQLQHFGELQALDVDGIDVNLSEENFVHMFHNKENLCRLLLNFGRALKRTYQLPQVSDHCAQLEHLTLENFDLNLPDIGEFRSLKSLRMISRWIGEVNNDFYRSLAKRYADHLEQLQFLSIRIGAAQVHHILALKRIKALECDNWPSEAVEKLSLLTELECLAIECINPIKGVNCQLLSVLSSCCKLAHLKLGKRWQMTSSEATRFLSDVRDVRLGSKTKLLLTLSFIKLKEHQQMLNDLFTNDTHLRLGFHDVCHYCRPDTHSRCDTIFD
ncbi:uncharacterized protein LOC117580466 isoform X3 [Drosophila guanche]|uniref:uncharacterized protein LOC117580466 isoform X3 n=1 Tax=Drosophila guanche TaxID=7266 RepID=UPI001471F444|nr:uncharacterized protein LOC117580466 isoform X3 [Drosophila guanche]